MPRTKLTVALVALCCVVLGLLLLWWSTALGTPLSIILGTLATVIITIGVVNLISDWILQRSITDDLISLIQTDRRLVEAGVDRFEQSEDVDWAELLSIDENAEFFVMDIPQFKTLIWPRVLDAAKSSLKTVNLVVVDVKKESTLISYARRRSQDGENLAAEVMRFESEVERERKAMKASSSTRCTLTLRRSTITPANAYFESQKFSALFIDPLGFETGHTKSHLIIFRTERRGRQFARWAPESAAALRARFTSPAYSDATGSTGEI